MAAKEAIMFALDAGHSMDQMYSENASRMKLSLECIEMTLQQKIYYNPSHQVGFGVFGDKDHDYNDDNFLLLNPIAIPTCSFLQNMNKFSKVRLNNEKAGGDIFRAILSCINVLTEDRIRKFKKKRIFLFTNGMGETVYDRFNIQKLALQIRADDIKVNIIPINFMEGYVIGQNQVENEIETEIQQNNAKLLMDLKAYAEDNVQIFPDQIAVELYKRFRKRQINPVAIYKGQFQLAPDLGIQVETYKYIRRERLKSLAKYDVNQPFNRNITKQKEIITKVTYIISGDETNTQIQKENQINAYQYGPHLVPISSILEKEAKFYQDKNLRLLGFVNKSQVHRAALMGQVQIMVPKKQSAHLPGQKLFTALVFSMISTQKYGIARYVPRNAKSGVIPRLMALIPYRSIDRQGIYMIDLPTVEDVRDYPFNSLKPATDKQSELVRDLVSRSQLYRKSDNIEQQQVKIQNTFNPTHQYFYQTVFYRVLHDEGDIPPLNEAISKYLRPQQRYFQENSLLIHKISKEFKFTKKQLAKQKLAKKQGILWKEVLQEQAAGYQDKSMVSSETGDDLKPFKHNFTDFNDNQLFDPANPVISFDKMLSNNKKDLVNVALKEMVNYIQSKSSAINLTDEAFNQLILCVSTMRRGCDDQRERQFWNDWLSQAQNKLPEKLYNKIISEGLGYFGDKNKLLYKIKQLHFVDSNDDVMELD